MYLSNPARRLIAGAVISVVLVTGLSAPQAQAAAPSPAQQWTEVQNLISGIKGVWTTQDYSGAVSTTMPNTALLGNGDIGVTSAGGTGFKTFYLSKGNFWAGNPNPSFVSLGGITIAAVGGGGGSSNLALGASATASSSHPSFPPSRAVSGQWGSGYEGWVSQIGKPQTLTIDLGTARTFTRYLVRHDSAARPAETANNTKNFTLQVSTNGTSWTTADTITNNSAATTDRTIASQTVRYVRLNITEPTQATTPDSINNPRARIGQLELYGSGGPAPSGPFREEENILSGDVDTTMTIGGTPVVMKTWTAANDNLVVTQIRSTGSSTVRLKADTWAGSAQPRSGFTNTAGISGTTTWATRRTPTGTRWVSEASLATRVVGASSTVSASGATASQTFDLPAGQTIRIVTAVAGGGQNPTGTASAAQSLVGAQTGAALDTLYTAHTEWWKQYWLKSYVDLNDDVLERYYYAHQYFLGSAIRQGKMAPGLYGVWATTDSPSFSGDMHLNYNFMANFYGVYSSNRADLGRPYQDLILAYVPEARRRAQQDLNRVKPDYMAARFPSGGMPSGLLFPVGIAPFGTTADNNYHQQVVNSLFAATQFIAYYDYTRDNTYLASTIYPFLKEVAAFFQNYLEFDSGAQRYNLWGGPHEGLWARNSSPDLGMLRYLLTSLVNASVTLNVDSSLRGTWQNILTRLAPIPTTVHNGQTVYALADPGTISGSDTRPIHPGDNTINLEFVHPGEVLGINSPAAERQIGINTVNAMNSWGQDNSFPKIFTQAARVGYPAQALIDQLKNQINQKTVANLRIYDSPHGLEKAGAIEAVNNMLLQSSGGIVRLFPVWPSSRDASFVNLREKGALLVSSRLQGGRVTYVDITAQVNSTIRLQSPWPGQTITVTRVGTGTVSHTDSGGIITFTGVAGATYTINAP